MKIIRDPELDEIFVEGKSGFEGRLLKVRIDKVKLPNGRITTREYIRHPGAVAIVPVLPDGSIVLVKQFRYATGSVLYEIPAGKIDPGEEPDACARRELSEETGYEAANWRYLTAIATTPGFTDELIHLYLAEGLEQFDQHTDPDEFVKIEVVAPETVVEMIRDGRICDGKTIAALGFLAIEKLK